MDADKCEVVHLFGDASGSPPYLGAVAAIGGKLFWTHMGVPAEVLGAFRERKDINRSASFVRVCVRVCACVCKGEGVCSGLSGGGRVVHDFALYVRVWKFPGQQHHGSGNTSSEVRKASSIATIREQRCITAHRYFIVFVVACRVMWRLR